MIYFMPIAAILLLLHVDLVKRSWPYALYLYQACSIIYQPASSKTIKTLSYDVIKYKSMIYFMPIAAILLLLHVGLLYNHRLHYNYYRTYCFTLLYHYYEFDLIIHFNNNINYQYFVC